jgi:isoquinoline 1-oxidoreductase alpha subunit
MEFHQLPNPMAVFRFVVNGEEREVDAAPEMPLLWVLRDLLDLTGTKYGCGETWCGACTVHVDGVAVRSCAYPVSRAEGASVTTIEGLSSDGTHPLQKAWKELDVAQCGFCQPGQLMEAAAWMRNTPKPTLEDIDRLQAGVLCRCGTYERIKKAIQRAGELS